MNIDFNRDDDVTLLLKALDGDEEATKMYCGSYKLVMITSSSGMYRTKELRPAFVEIKEYVGRSVYDKDGFLMPVFWSLPRL